MAQLPDPTVAPTPEMQELLDRMTARRGRIDGMYRSLLNHPELARHVSDLGGFLRFHGVLPDDLRELAILWVARQLQVEYEWVKHVEVAREAGLSPELIEAMRTGQELPALTPTQQAVLAAADCVLNLQPVPQAIQEKLTAEVGLTGVVELVVLCGFYRMIAGVIRGFDVPLPPAPL